MLDVETCADSPCINDIALKAIRQALDRLVGIVPPVCNRPRMIVDRNGSAVCESRGIEPGKPPLMVRFVRVRRAMRRPGKCEELDNQETGLCVAALCAARSKWVPTTIHNIARAHQQTPSAKERWRSTNRMERSWMEN